MKTHIAMVLTATLTCGGCATGIQVTSVPGGDSQVTGVPWNLAMTQFNVTITRSVIGCGPSLKGSVQVTATPTKVMDAEQRYALSSNGWWATSDITSALATDGTSTGLNATSADATATVISNVVGTVGQIALLGFGGGAAGRGGLRATSAEVCVQDPKNNVLAAVNEMYPSDGQGLKFKVDADTAALTAATMNVSTLTAQAQADASYKKALAEAIGTQATAQMKLTADQSELAKDLKLTSDTQLVTWPLQARQFGSDPNLLDPKTFSKWSTNVDGGEAKAKFAVHMAIYRQADDGTWAQPPPSERANVKVGVPVRLARMGLLAVCSGNSDANKRCPDTLPAGQTSTDGLFISAQPVLQLGRMYIVPLTGGTFKSETAVIALDPTTGLPTSIEVSEKVAAAAAASGMLLNTATQATALPAQIAAARLAAIQAKSNQITAQTALAAAVANSQIAGQIAPLTAQAALNAANASALTALGALAAAQANDMVVGQTSALAAHTSLLNAQAAQLNATAALAKAQAIP